MKSNLWKPISLLILLIVVTATLFPVLRFSYVNYDDPSFVVANPVVNRGLTRDGIQWAFTPQSGGDALPSGNNRLWIPLTWISHMVDIELWGQSWGKHHLGNLVLHLISTTLIFFLALKFKIKLPGAFLAATLFSLHPLGAETASWLSDRSGALGTTFALASLFTYQYPKIRWLSLLLFLGGLLSKSGVLILPALIVLTTYLQSKKPVTLKWLTGQIRKTSAWWALTLGVALLNITLQAQSLQNDSLVEDLTMMPSQWSFYAFRALVPINYSFHYTSISPFNKEWFAGVSLLFFIGLTVVAWTRRKKSRAGLFALGWAFLSWLPISGLVYAGTSFTADRYAYLIFIGPFLALGSYFGNWAAKHSRVTPAVLFVTVSALSVLMSKEIGKWRNTAALYANAAEAQAHDWTANFNYGVYLLRERQIPEALSQLKKAALISPDHPSVQYHLGIASARSGNIDEAIAAYQKSLQGDPSSTQTWISYGHLLEYNKPEMAEEIEDAYLQAVILSQSSSPSPLLFLSRFYLSRNQPEKAKKHFEKVKLLPLTNPEHQKLFQLLEKRIGP